MQRNSVKHVLISTIRSILGGYGNEPCVAVTSKCRIDTVVSWKPRASIMITPQDMCPTKLFPRSPRCTCPATTTVIDRQFSSVLVLFGHIADVHNVAADCIDQQEIA